MKPVTRAVLNVGLAVGTLWLVQKPQNLKLALPYLYKTASKVAKKVAFEAGKVAIATEAAYDKAMEKVRL